MKAKPEPRWELARPDLANFAAAVIRRTKLLALAVAGLCQSLSFAVQAPELRAVDMNTDVATGEAVFTGNAHLAWENALITADEIRYNPKTNVATARGHVTLTRGPRRLLADELRFRVEDETFTIENVRFGQYPFYLTAKHAEGGRDKITASQALVSYGEPYFLAPAVRAGKIIYVPEQTISAESARIGLGTTVPLSLPQFHQSVKEPLLSYMDAHVGYRASLGAHVGLGAQLPVWQGVKLGGGFGYYTKRGLLIGPAGSYDTQWGSQEMTGSFHSGYIHDVGNRLQDVLGRPIEKDRGYFEWTHHQDVTPDLAVFGQLRYWSDSEIIRDFIPEEFFEVQTPDSFLESVYTGKNYTVSLFTRFQPNRYIRVQERLPELRFDLLPTPIGHGIYERFNASLAVLREDAVADRIARTSNRFDAYYGLTRPISPREWLTLTPVVGGRLTHYTHTVDRSGDYTRALGEVGFDANLQMSGVYNYKNERWNIDGIRHLLTPRLSYRYIPSADKGQQAIPAIDRTVFSTYLQPLDLGDQRNIDELHPTNTLRIGLDNTFQTRDKHYGSRDLLIVNVAADLRSDRMVGESKFSAIQTELAFMPADWLQFDMYQSIDPKDFNVEELNTGIRIVDSNVWSVRFSNRYLAQQIQEYILDGRYQLTEAYQIFTRLHFDARESRFVERTVGLHQNLHNLWSLEYAVSFFSGRRRESNFGFALKINLVGL